MLTRKAVQATELPQFAKFIAVGSSGAVVNLGLLAVLHTLGLNIAVAAIIAIEASVLWNFACNDRWTFASVSIGQCQFWWHRCWRYHLITGVGALLTYVVILTLSMRIDLVPAGIIGIAVAALWNFGLSKKVIYKGKA